MAARLRDASGGSRLPRGAADQLHAGDFHSERAAAAAARRAAVAPVSYAVNGKTSPKWSRAFALGCGGLATNDSDLKPGDVALFGDPSRWDLLQTARLEGRNWYYGDHAYYRRNAYYRITKNGFQYQGPPSEDRTRFERLHVNCAPEWRKEGSSIIICPNSPTYMRLFGIDAQQWVLEVVAELAKHTDRPMVIRWKQQAQVRPIYCDLHDAWATVVFSSAAAIDGLLAGVPCITLAPFAATRRMGGTALSEIEALPMPDDREPFLWALAERQWTLAEIERGEAWAVLNA